MAVVDQVYTVEFYVEDRKGKSSHISLYVGAVGTELTLANLIDTADALELIFDPLTGGNLRRASAKIYLYKHLPGIPDPDSDVEKGAMFIFYAEDSDTREIWRMPTFLESLYEDDLKVDDTHPDVITLYDAIEAGIEIDGITYRFCNSEGETVIVSSAGKDFQANSYLRQP